MDLPLTVYTEYSESHAHIATGRVSATAEMLLRESQEAAVVLVMLRFYFSLLSSHNISTNVLFQAWEE